MLFNRRIAERWPSGLRRRFAKPLYGQKLYPGFESLPLRQFPRLPALFSHRIAPALRVHNFVARTAPLILEEEFRGQLNQTGWIGADHLAEGGTADIAVDRLRSEELRVVEDIEAFQAELERL